MNNLLFEKIWEDADLSAESFFSIGLAEYDNLGHYKFVLKFGFQNDDNKNYGCSFPITTKQVCYYILPKMCCCSIKIILLKVVC